VMLTGLSFILYIIYYIYVLYVVLHILNLPNLTHVTSISRRHMFYTEWSRTAILQQESPSHQGTEKTDCSVEESERELVVPLKPRNRERNG